MLRGLLIKNIRCLVQTEDVPKLKVCGKEMSELKTVENGWLYIRDGLIKDFGEMSRIRSGEIKFDSEDVEMIDATGRFVFPSFCDSHTHIVYAGSREIEYSDKIRGLSYAEIARRGGGIINSAKKLHETSEDELFAQSLSRINEIIGFGTGAVEIKSGYGLNLEDELKMLRVIRRIKGSSLLEVKATFLGAHALPPEYKGRKERFVDLIINEMIPIIASEDLAEFIDVFCDDGFFSVKDTERILMAGMKYGLTPKLHANELGFSGGI
jgi:imidazolonepropionase